MVKTSSPSLPSGGLVAGAGVDHLDEEVVLHHVQTVVARALAGDARADDLRQPINVEGGQAELLLELRAHRLRPWLGAEHPDLQREPPRADTGLPQALGDVQGVRGRGAQDLALEVLESTAWRAVTPPETGTVSAPRRSAP